MSTILKALKKLEQETQAAGTAAAFQTLSDSPAEPPAPRHSRLWAGVGIGASLIGLGLVLFFILRPAAAPPTQPQGQPVPVAPPKVATAPEDRLPMPNVFPPRQPGEPESAAPPQRPAAQTPAPPAAPTQTPANEVAAEPPVVARTPKAPPAPRPEQKAEPIVTPEVARLHRPAAPPTPAPKEKAPPQPQLDPSPSPPVSPAKPQAPIPAPTPEAAIQAAPREEPVQAPVVPATTAAAPSAAQPTAPEPQPAAVEEEPVSEAPPDPYANVPRLEENSPIKLQAISWAESAEKSIAVINNSVLHEGDSVEGYSVVKIRPDDVIVRREGRMWRANFSIR